MSNSRLEAFSDGVIAIIITIMVLELKAARGEPGCAAAAAAKILELSTQLHLRRYLLEQPPSHAARLRGGDGIEAAIAYWILQQMIIAAQGPDSLLKKAVGSDWKGKLSPVLYLIGAAAGLRSPRLAQGIYALVALLWLVPDRRIEKVLLHR